MPLAVPNLHASVQLGVRQQRNGVGDHAAIRMQLRVLKGIFYIGVTSAHTAVIPRNRCPKRRAALRAVRGAVVPSMLAVRAGGRSFRRPAPPWAADLGRARTPPAGSSTSLSS